MSENKTTTMKVAREDLQKLDMIRAHKHAGDSRVTYRELLNDALEAYEELYDHEITIS